MRAFAPDLHNPLLSPRPAAGPLPSESEAVFFGTGLVTPRAITQGVPFDFYGFLLSAEHLRRESNAKKILHIFADSLALASKPVGERPEVLTQIATCATRYHEVAAQLGWEDTYEFLHTSEIETRSEFIALHENITAQDLPVPDMMKSYVTGQLALMAYLEKEHGAGIKLSWQIDPKAKKVGLDERYFDSLYAEVFPDTDLTCVYTAAGRSLNSTRARVSPYLLTEPPTERLKLGCTQAEFATFTAAIDQNNDRSAAEGMLRHLRDIVALREDLLGYCPGRTLADKVQAILQPRANNILTPTPAP